MVRPRLSDKLNLFDQCVHELVKRFYRPLSSNGSVTELSSSELFACNVLGRRGPCTMSQLAEECGLALSSMTGVVDRLVSREYAKRSRDHEKDRRKVFVELAQKGQRIYQELLESEMEMIITMMEALKPQEQDALLHALEKAVGSLGK